MALWASFSVCLLFDMEGIDDLGIRVEGLESACLGLGAAVGTEAHCSVFF